MTILGKTSLLHVLQDKDIQAFNSTIGVDVNASKVETKEVDFQIWDFAGQIEYSSTHQVLLSSDQSNI